MTEPTTDAADDLPAEWSDSVRATFLAIEEAHGEQLSPEAATTLYEAAAMLHMAEQLDAQVTTDGLTIINARGAVALHPGIAEARAQRRTALAALKAIGLRSRSASSGSAAGAALAGARWSKP